MPPPRASLGFFPTPGHALTGLQARRAMHNPCPRLFIKRDDNSGVALGGNKVRKLEFLVGDALSQGCDTLVTAGAQQSNHCRQTAAAAGMCGLSCHLVLGGKAPEMETGNLLLDRILGATIHFAGANRKGEDLPHLMRELRAGGRKPYLVPYGGSNALGATGFVAAMAELRAQIDTGELPVASHIVFASSSGGTHAGLIVGARLYGFDSVLYGIEIDKEEHQGLIFSDWVVRLSNETATLHDLDPSISATDITLDNRFVGSGYAAVGDLEREAIALMARNEGILLDPVYTGRAFGALVAMIRNGEFSTDDTVLFWHTGGAPALFAYGDKL